MKWVVPLLALVFFISLEARDNSHESVAKFIKTIREHVAKPEEKMHILTSKIFFSYLKLCKDIEGFEKQTGSLLQAQIRHAQWETIVLRRVSRVLRRLKAKRKTLLMAPEQL